MGGCVVSFAVVLSSLPTASEPALSPLPAEVALIPSLAVPPQPTATLPAATDTSHVPTATATWVIEYPLPATLTLLATRTSSSIYTGAVPKAGTSSRAVYDAFTAYLNKDEATLSKSFHPTTLYFCQHTFRTLAGCMDSYYSRRGLRVLNRWHIRSGADEHFVTVVSQWNNQDAEWSQVYAMYHDGTRWVIDVLNRPDPEIRDRTTPQASSGSAPVFMGTAPALGTAQRAVYDAFTAYMNNDEAALLKLYSSQKIDSCKATWGSMVKCIAYPYRDRSLQVLNTWRVQGTIFKEPGFEGVNLVTKWNNQAVEWIQVNSVVKQDGRWIIKDYQKIQPSSP